MSGQLFCRIFFLLPKVHWILEKSFLPSIEKEVLWITHRLTLSLEGTKQASLKEGPSLGAYARRATSTSLIAMNCGGLYKNFVLRTVNKTAWIADWLNLLLEEAKAAYLKQGPLSKGFGLPFLSWQVLEV